jgi:hypothetical protein
MLASLDSAFANHESITGLDLAERNVLRRDGRRSWMIRLWRTPMPSQPSAVLIEPVRTAIGTLGGSLKDVPAANLGAVAISAAIGRAGLRPEEVETVVMGNVIQAGNKMNPARQAAIHAGLPVTTPALTVNRVCGSGAQAIVSAAQEILWAISMSR